MFVTETICPVKSKIFAIWPFTGKEKKEKSFYLGLRTLLGTYFLKTTLNEESLTEGARTGGKET